MCPATELELNDLRRICDTSRFTFSSTADLEPTKKIIGQPRGTHAIEFGIAISSPGFNIYVLGPTGSGRTTTIERFLQEKAIGEPAPCDWVYVQNFTDIRRPRAIALPSGMGIQFGDDIRKLIESLQREMPKAFEKEEYSDARDKITRGLETARHRILQDIQLRATEHGFTIIRTPDTLAVTPVLNGEPMTMEAYQALSQEEQEKLDETRQTLERKLEDALKSIMGLEQDAREQVITLNRKVASSTVGQFIGQYTAKYAAEEEALLHLNLVQNDIVDNVELFRAGSGAENESPEQDQDPFLRYQVNLIVDHSKTTGAPVLAESNPSYHNLVGRIEYDVKMGSPTTDFTNIKAGSLHKANGGYLVIRATYLLSNPYAWGALKRALTDGVIRLEEPAAENIATKTLDPEPIPLNIKIVLMGSPAIYYMLFEADEDFSKLFKVRADFDSDMDYTPDNEDETTLFIASRCHEEGLCHFDKDAVGKIIEYSARLAGSQDRLSTRFGEVADAMREASYWAKQDSRGLVTGSDVKRAIRERVFRSNLAEERLRRFILEGQIFIDVTGAKVGQINGLYVVEVGGYRFGQPSRITAQTYMGKAGVVSIEREVELAGPLHNRGVMTLTGYLGGTYAQDCPLSISASLAFEQNYGGIEGDSASSAELYALLSSLSGIPIKQGVAVTGSVNQWGQVQPIGGVTEKIEGFFAVCQSQGLNGEQGVIVPVSNKKALMLREEVVEAVQAGRFHIWTVETIDQGIELLTGVPAGVRGADGNYPEGTVHHAIQERLKQYAEELESYSEE